MDAELSIQKTLRRSALAGIRPDCHVLLTAANVALANWARARPDLRSAIRAPADRKPIPFWDTRNVVLDR
jgi:hypothetical protein